MKKDLQRFAQKIRLGTIDAIGTRGFGHVGGSLSIADLLAVLYGAVMKVDPKNPRWEDRDKLVCSKGHAGPAVYAALALKGYFPYEELKTLNQPGTNFPSHCDKKKTPGIDVTTGSLGQGTSLAVGMAMGDLLKKNGSRTFLIVGDGESDEGQVWEAAMFAAAKKVTNLVWILDNNKKQLDGYVKDVFDTGDLRAKMEAFGFDAVRIDGHDVEALYDALTKEATDKPIAIVLDTLKGKGVKDAETAFGNHSMKMNLETRDKWLAEIQADLDKLA